MWMFIGTIIVASLLGSMHCVGMCGPLAMWASGVGQTRANPSLTTSLYHFGRLVTYALAGAVAGLLGQLTDISGRLLGFQTLAAQIVGSLMIVAGIWKLSQLFSARRRVDPKPLKPSRISGWLVSVRPFVFRLPLAGRALATGLLTALLPCGWLYLFALVAAGTGSLQGGVSVMIAFWIGSVPALVGLVAGAQLLTGKIRLATPLFAATVLIIAGCYTALGRGFADLHGLNTSEGARLFKRTTIDATHASHLKPSSSNDSIKLSISEAIADIDRLLQTPLPCCEGEIASDTRQLVDERDRPDGH
jgi:uncharacterized protein